MKKIDKLVLDAFIGPFLITFLVVVFILLNINMLKYFDDIIGKGLDASVLGQLFFYFAIFTVPTAMPLAVLLSTLIAFGNLGEHFELTAIKSAGISLIRILRPIFFFVLVLTAIAFYANNNLVPKAALEAYSLLYDIKQKKPALELRAGVFYRGIDNLSIKVSEKFPEDEQALKGVIVYDHRKNDGNKEVTIADSGRMYTILNERYLKFELFNGYNYIEGVASESGVSQPSSQKESISRSKFKKTQVVFDLSSFKLQTTDKKWFQGNRIMRNISELQDDMDSLKEEVMNQRLSYYLSRQTHFTFYKTGDSLILPPEISRHRALVDSMNNATYLKKSAEKKASGSTPDGISSVDTARRGRIATELRPTNDRRKDLRDIALKHREPAEDTTTQIAQKVIRKSMGFDSLGLAKIDSIFGLRPPRDALQGAANTARQIKSQITNSNSSIENYQKELVTFQIQWHKIWASSFACIAMFLIGAPLGAIIKKGGLGVPFLVSIFFFIIYYVFTMQGEKLAKQNTLGVATGVWVADAILFCVGLIFLRQARIDARLFEADFYSVLKDKVKRWVGRRKEASAHPG